MIDLDLQRDSYRRLSEIEADIELAKEQGKAALQRQLHKELDEERKVLKLIERVKVA